MNKIEKAREEVKMGERALERGDMASAIDHALAAQAWAGAAAENPSDEDASVEVMRDVGEFIHKVAGA